MARIVRGPVGYRRKNAKNFIQEEAQKRLNETVEPFNKQVETRENWQNMYVRKN